MPEAAASAGAGGAASEERHERGASRGPSDEGLGTAERLLKRYRGQAKAAIAAVADEAKELRVERRELREKLKTFEGPDVIVLRGDDAKAFTAYKELGKPEDLKKLVGEELPALRTKVSEADRKANAALAAPHLGWNPDATAALIIDKQLEVSLVDGKDAAGKDIKVPHVRPLADPKAVPVPLSKWQADNAAYLTPALTAKPTSGTAGASGTQQPKPGVPMVEQTTGAGNGTQSAAGAKQIPGRPAYLTPAQRAAAEKK